MKKYWLISLVAAVAIAVGSAAHAVDPNCNTNLVNNGPINNYLNPTNAQRSDGSDVIAMLTFADLYRMPPFRINNGRVRLDVQGAIPGGGRNWQVQVNGVHGNSTIAHANIAGTLAGASTAERQRYVERKFRNALVSSLNSGDSFALNGNCN